MGNCLLRIAIIGVLALIILFAIPFAAFLVVMVILAMFAALIA